MTFHLSSPSPFHSLSFSPSLQLRLTLLGEGKRTVKADICARKDGVYKAMLMRKLYRTHPCFLPLFSLVTEWARVQGVVRSASPNEAAGEVKTSSGGAEEVMMKSGFLHAIVLHILMKGGNESKREEREKTLQSGMGEEKGEGKGHECKEGFHEDTNKVGG